MEDYNPYTENLYEYVFIADMFISTLVAWRLDEKHMTYNHTLVHYLCRWFTVDLIAAIPLNLIFYELNRNHIFLLLKYLRLTYVVRSRTPILSILLYLSNLVFLPFGRSGYLFLYRILK